MLDSLHIKNFRCFEDLTIPSLGRVNLIVGKNNSGKSTLLEAVAVYASAANKQYIQYLREQRHDHTGEIFNLFNSKTKKNTLTIGDIDNINYLIIAPKEELKANHLGFEKERSPRSSHKKNNLFQQEEKLSAFCMKDGKARFDSKPSFYLSTQFIDDESLAKLWDYAFKFIQGDVIYQSLRIIDEKIENIAFIPENISIRTTDSPFTKIKEVRIPMLKIQGQSQAIPLRSFGEGALRVLQMVLASLQSSGGYLMIDEFENGLHYSIQEEVWGKLFKLAKELDIQVFATTHSEDTVKAFCKVALRSPEEGQIIYLARHMREQDPDKGKISAIVYNENDLEMILQTGMEVR